VFSTFAAPLTIIAFQQLLHAIVNGWQQMLRNISVDVEKMLLISSIKGAILLISKYTNSQRE